MDTLTRGLLRVTVDDVKQREIDELRRRLAAAHPATELQRRLDAARPAK